MELIDIVKKLLKCKSVTPNDDGAIEFIKNLLDKNGFSIEIIEFGDGMEKIKNLYARYKTASPNFCFAGHTDVVPPGNLDKWEVDPFAAIIKNGYLIGRGICDMKGAIAAFIYAAINFIKDYEFEGSISFLITGDEEAKAENGTKKLVKWLAEKEEKLNACLVGEPTNSTKLGEIIKNGRRGSITFFLEIIGIQGHVAYPNLADNPITKLIKIINELKNTKLDDSTEFFEPSNLEIVNLEVDNKATNVIPFNAKAVINIRYNNLHVSSSLIKMVNSIVRKYAFNKYNLNYESSGDAFLTNPGNLTKILQESIKEVTGLNAKLATNGGTSDARFIKDYCEVIEFGLINATAHQVNEKALVKDLEDLAKIYYNLLKKYYKK